MKMTGSVNCECGNSFVVDAPVQHPGDEFAQQRAQRDAIKLAAIQAEAAGWEVQNHVNFVRGTKDRCPECKRKAA